jgi:hypothetical protein
VVKPLNPWPRPPSPRRPVITSSLKDLEALRALGVDVFTCAHHWVTDESILDHLLSKEPYERPRCSHHHGCKCNHAAIVAGMVFALLHGKEFPPLYLRVHQGRVRGAVSSLELVDGHHRLRARQFSRSTYDIRWAVKGDAALLRRAVAQARRDR